MSIQRQPPWSCKLVINLVSFVQVCDLVMFIYCRSRHSSRRQRVSINLILKTSGFSIGVANGHYKSTSAVPSASVGWLQSELVCNDSRNTVWMMPPSLSYCSLEGEDRVRDGKMVWRWLPWIWL